MNNNTWSATPSKITRAAGHSKSSPPRLFGAKHNLKCGDKSRAARGLRHRFPARPR